MKTLYNLVRTRLNELSSQKKKKETAKNMDQPFKNEDLS